MEENKNQIKEYILKDLVDFTNGKGHEKDIVEEGKYIVVNSKFISSDGNVKKYSDKQICPVFVDDILMVMSDLPNGRALAKCFIVEEDDKYTLNQRICGLTIRNKKVVLPKYLYYFLNRNIQLLKFNNGVDQTNLKKDDILNICVTIPSIEEQERIVKVLDTFSSLIENIDKEYQARNKQFDYYYNKIVRESEYPLMKLGDIGQVKMCKRILKSQTNTIGGIPFYKIGTFGKDADAYITEETFNEYKTKYAYPSKGDILISCSGTIGRTVIFDGNPAYFQDSNIVWLEHDSSKVLNEYLFYCYMLQPWQVASGGTIARLYNDNILKAEIPVPPIEEQKRIVDILNKFYKIINDKSVGLLAEIDARYKQFEYYKDLLLNPKEDAVNE